MCSLLKHFQLLVLKPLRKHSVFEIILTSKSSVFAQFCDNFFENLQSFFAQTYSKTFSLQDNFDIKTVAFWTRKSAKTLIHFEKKRVNSRETLQTSFWNNAPLKAPLTPCPFRTPARQSPRTQNQNYRKGWAIQLHLGCVAMIQIGGGKTLTSSCCSRYGYK